LCYIVRHVTVERGEEIERERERERERGREKEKAFIMGMSSKTQRHNMKKYNIEILGVQISFRRLQKTAPLINYS